MKNISLWLWCDYYHQHGYKGITWCADRLRALGRACHLMHFKVFEWLRGEREKMSVSSFPRTWRSVSPVNILDALIAYGDVLNLINFIIFTAWKKRTKLDDMWYDRLFGYSLGEKTMHSLLLDPVREDMPNTNLAFVIIFEAFIKINKTETNYGEIKTKWKDLWDKCTQIKECTNARNRIWPLIEFHWDSLKPYSYPLNTIT